MIDGYIKFIRRFLPSPFSIALILTLISFIGVLAFNGLNSGKIDASDTISWWMAGLWNTNLLVFAMQMMLMLVLGHVLALTPAVERLINLIVSKIDNSANAAALVSFSALFVGLFNWGLGLIFGAILARKVGELFSKNHKPLNYALIGAAGYAALMIWHGGISGSALIKVAESQNLHAMMGGILNPSQMVDLPDRIGLEATVFSTPNVLTSIFILFLVPTALYITGRISSSSNIQLDSWQQPQFKPHKDLIGAEYMDSSAWTTKIAGGGFLIFCVYQMIDYEEFLSFFNPNNINLCLFGLALFLHKSILSFLNATDSAISGASGILIQFPLYFGIMGLFNESGLVSHLSDLLISMSSESTFPFFTFLSAGLVNIFVPSGGGQWVIQGPIIIKAAMELGVPFNKAILALAYGDQITNMLQPFWALPLLGITKLSAKDILPYTLIMFLVGFIVYSVSVLI